MALVQTDLKRVIAYSTMSQIGYMIMGVSVAAYGAGIFHLMTHAFFKALLFMGAGSVIGAMAGEQSMDRMGGFRKAMPFTFATFLIGALALAGFPLMSGLLLQGRDPGLHAQPRRLVRGPGRGRLHRRAAHRLLRVPDGVPGVLRAGRCPRPRSSRAATCTTASTTTRPPASTRTPTSASPAPSTTIAEREWPMKAAMAPLARAGHHRRRAGHPRRDRHARALPGAHVRRLASTPTCTPRPAPSGPAC